MSKKRFILIGLVLLGVALVAAAVPWSEGYSSFGLGLTGRVDVECGSVLSPEIEVEFADSFEQDLYDEDRRLGFEPRIFEGKTAAQVCDDLHQSSRIVAILTGIAGAVLLGVGTFKSQPSAAVAPTTSRANGAPPEPGSSAPESSGSTPPALSGSERSKPVPPEPDVVPPEPNDHQPVPPEPTPPELSVSEPGVVPPEPNDHQLVPPEPTPQEPPVPEPGAEPIGPNSTPPDSTISRSQLQEPTTDGPAAQPDLGPDDPAWRAAPPAIPPEPAASSAVRPPPIPPQPTAAAPAARRSAGPACVHVVGVATIDGGAEIFFARHLVIGRNPAAPDGIADAETRSITDDFTISKTHVLIGVEDDDVWVEDLHSANGTFLVTGSEETELRPGMRRLLGTGGVIRVGETRVSIATRRGA